MFFRNCSQGPVLERPGADVASTGRFGCHFRFSEFPKRRPLDHLFYKNKRVVVCPWSFGDVLGPTRETLEDRETSSRSYLRFFLRSVLKARFAFSITVQCFNNLNIFVVFAAEPETSRNTTRIDSSTFNGQLVGPPFPLKSWLSEAKASRAGPTSAQCSIWGRFLMLFWWIWW